MHWYNAMKPLSNNVRASFSDLALQAIYLLKQNYPDVKLYIAGDNIIDTSTFTRKIKMQTKIKRNTDHP